MKSNLAKIFFIFCIITVSVMSEIAQSSELPSETDISKLLNEGYEVKAVGDNGIYLQKGHVLYVCRYGLMTLNTFDTCWLVINYKDTIRR